MATSVKELSAEVSELKGSISEIMSMLKAAQSAPKVEAVEAPKSNTAMGEIMNLGHAEARKLAISYGFPIGKGPGKVSGFGVVGQRTREELAAKLGANAKSSAPKITPKVSDPDIISTRFGDVKPRTAESQVRRPKAADAAEQLAKHPYRQQAEAITDDEWRAIRAMGAGIYKGWGKDRVVTGTKPNPANLMGNHRVCANIMAGGKRTPNLLLVGAEIAQMLDAAGLL